VPLQWNVASVRGCRSSSSSAGLQPIACSHQQSVSAHTTLSAPPRREARQPVAAQVNLRGMPSSDSHRITSAALLA
jgi:hypothetical protein